MGQHVVQLQDDLGRRLGVGLDEQVQLDAGGLGALGQALHPLHIVVVVEESLDGPEQARTKPYRW